MGISQRADPGTAKRVFYRGPCAVLKKFVKEYKKEAESETFLKQLPHTYYEEYMVHILLLGEIKDYDTCMKAVEEFLPYIDNWAICDVLSPKVFKNHKPELLERSNSGSLLSIRISAGLALKC